MEWLACIRKSIGFIEVHLLDDIGAQDVARQVHVSPFLLQRGFSVVTGFGIAEYIRNRRLHLAAIDLVKSGEKVIDIAFRYGYETPESLRRLSRGSTAPPPRRCATGRPPPGRSFRCRSTSKSTEETK